MRRAEARKIRICRTRLQNRAFCAASRMRTVHLRDGSSAAVWFLEACDLNVFAIRRAIWQMEHAGWFQYVKGFLIGRPLQFGQKFGELDQYRAVTDLLGKYNVPIVMDLDIGHLHPAMPLIVGSYAKVAVEGNEIEIKMECR